jgi:hypothetical protein
MAQRPKDTYVSQVFNFGVDKNIPFGFVNVVFNKNGSMAGYIRNGKFYEPGEKLPEAKSEESIKKQYSGSIAERVAEAEKELAETRKAADFASKQNRDKMGQREATARGDIYDNYASSLKPQIDEYEFKLDFYARKIALGDKLSGIEENEIKDISKKYASIKKAYNEARIDAVDLYYGKKTTAETPTGQKIASGKIKVADKGIVAEQTPAKPLEQAPVAPATPTTPTSKTPSGTVDKKPVQQKEAQPQLDTTIFEPTVTIGGAPAGYVPEGTSPVNAATAQSKEADALKLAAGADFGLSEALFKNIPTLKTIFDEYTNPKSGMTNDEFIKRIRNDVWFKKNSKEIKTRFVQYYNYRDLQESGQADGSTDYEMQISKIERNLKKRAVEIGSAAASDPIALRKAAENLYITNRSEDTTFVDDFLASAIRPVSGMIGGKVTEGYSGQALSNYNTLLKAARDNGFQMSDILPGGANEQQVLAGIASGTIDINRVAQDARKLASQGQPQYVRDLLSQGYNLAQVFQPYRQTMANILEIGDPEQINLNDPLLRTAITDKGDMNLYDFKKALRQDNRWQYTEQAKEDVSTAALNVLRDFGFQG